MAMSDFLTPNPRSFAHRGNSVDFPENTLPAFSSAHEMGIDVIETDVHLARDGEIVIWHDDTLERNTDGKGKVESFTLKELKGFDAAYTFTRDGGKTYPFRGKGVRMSTLEEALTMFPSQRFNVDLKTDDTKIVEAYARVIRKCGAEHRVCTASFHQRNIDALRALEPKMLTSVSTKEIVPLVLSEKFRLKVNNHGRKLVFQMPWKAMGIRIVTPHFVKAMHSVGATIEIWTVNDEEEMDMLFGMGIDGIMTDRPDTLLKVLKRRDSGS